MLLLFLYCTDGVRRHDLDNDSVAVLAIQHQKKRFQHSSRNFCKSPRWQTSYPMLTWRFTIFLIYMIFFFHHSYAMTVSLLLLLRIMWAYLFISCTCGCVHYVMVVIIIDYVSIMWLLWFYVLRVHNHVYDLIGTMWLLCD